MIEFGQFCSVIDISDIELVTTPKCQKQLLLSPFLHKVVACHLKVLQHASFSQHTCQPMAMLTLQSNSV
jgi:hypothetical protein